MRFDFGSFIIGAIVAFAISFVAYRRREQLGALWLKIRARLEAIKNQLTAGVEQRYSKALLAHCDQLALTMEQADFDAIYVAQKLDPPPARPTLNPIDPESRKPVPIAVGLRSTQRLAVLGQSGTGRTTLLSHLARVHLDKQAEVELGTTNRLPILVHLAEVEWSKANDNDPLGTLLPAATAHVPSLIQPNVAGLMKNRLRSGSAILLLDGLDEVSSSQRARIVHWLAALLTNHPNNQVVVTTGLLGYGALQNLGFAALKLSDWAPREVDRFTENWIAVLGGGRQDRKVLTEGVRQMSDLTTSPIDFTLALMDWRTRTRFPASRVEAYDHWLERAVRPIGFTEDLMSADKLSAALGQVAWVTYQEQRLDVGLDEIEQAIASALPAPTGEAPAAKGAPTAANTSARAIADKSGLFIPFGADAYAFAHRRLAAYLAAYHAVHSSLTLDEYWDQPEWADVFDFYAALTDPAANVGRALTSPDDFSRSHLWTAARWTGLAATDAPWRSRTMGELARTFLQPDQLTPLRERALDGLVNTHDKGLAFLLKRGLTQNDVTVRMLCLRGLGQLGREGDLPIFNAALKDPDVEVRYTAIRAIAQMARNGSGPAMELLIRLLLELDEDGQRLVAELLADCGEEGHQILREAAGEDEIKVRRAATFGLAIIGTDWARELLQKMEREESQWYVRQAALDALNRMTKNAAPPAEQPPLDLSPVVIEQQGWLVEWAAQQGIGIGVGRQSTNALMRALEQGQPNVRQAALQTLRYVGDLELHDRLRAMLTDPDKSVRDAAYLTLEAIGQKEGVALPR
jgi:HEAT repeat protein/energy-coupling factor transporter ATP-binding protein EcfA2